MLDYKLQESQEQILKNKIVIEKIQVEKSHIEDNNFISTSIITTANDIIVSPTVNICDVFNNLETSMLHLSEADISILFILGEENSEICWTTSSETAAVSKLLGKLKTKVYSYCVFTLTIKYIYVGLSRNEKVNDKIKFWRGDESEDRDVYHYHISNSSIISSTVNTGSVQNSAGTFYTYIYV